MSEEVKARIQEIVDNETKNFESVKTHLDKISLRSLDSISEHVVIAIEIDEAITDEEKAAQDLFFAYVVSRMTDECTSDNWTQIAIAESINEYSDNIDKINREFKERTKLKGSDVAFLMGATMLQVARVLIINALTKVQPAGKGNAKEKWLHQRQDDVFKEIDRDTSEESSRLHASLDHILSTSGVPYDVTSGGAKFKIFIGGSNHRSSTLAHDPAIGLVFGPSNIMTNCLSSVKTTIFNVKIPETFSVGYDAFGKKPHMEMPVSTTEMLFSATKRAGSEPKAAAASLLKHIIHIGTDLYTPCGIQLPLANLVLDKAHTEKLTEYVSTGDVLKVGAQAGLAVLINWLIASLHGCSLIFKDDGSPFTVETYQT